MSAWDKSIYIPAWSFSLSYTITSHVLNLDFLQEIDRWLSEFINQRWSCQTRWWSDLIASNTCTRSSDDYCWWESNGDQGDNNRSESQRLVMTSKIFTCIGGFVRFEIIKNMVDLALVEIINNRAMIDKNQYSGGSTPDDWWKKDHDDELARSPIRPWQLCKDD